MSVFISHMSQGAYVAFRTIIPEPADRIPWTPSLIPLALVSWIPFVFMAYLARRPDTYLIRLLLLPTVVVSAIAINFRHYWTIPQLNVYNWGQSLLAEVMIAKALEYALTPEGMLKVGEVSPGVQKGKKAMTANGHDGTRPDSGNAQPHTFFPKWFADAIELSHTMRGIRWKFGVGSYVPKQTRPLERRPFLRATALSFIKNFLILDFLETFIKLFPGVGSVVGGSMFYKTLPLVQRYLVSSAIHLMTGFALLAGFIMVQELITLVAVGVFNDSPNSWPPVLDAPWEAESMHELWAKRWHQLLRRTFVFYGGIPGNWIAGNVGAVLGTFLASGMYHELSMYTMGRGFQLAPFAFFAMQGPVLIMERLWRMIVGRRVGGWIGRLWVYFIMFVCAQPMIDSWHRRGFGGGLIIPPFISPAKLLLPRVLPFIIRVVLSKKEGV